LNLNEKETSERIQSGGRKSLLACRRRERKGEACFSWGGGGLMWEFKKVTPMNLYKRSDPKLPREGRMILCSKKDRRAKPNTRGDQTGGHESNGEWGGGGGFLLEINVGGEDERF